MVFSYIFQYFFLASIQLGLEQRVSRAAVKLIRQHVTSTQDSSGLFPFQSALRNNNKKKKVFIVFYCFTGWERRFRRKSRTNGDSGYGLFFCQLHKAVIEINSCLYRVVNVCTAY